MLSGDVREEEEEEVEEWIPLAVSHRHDLANQASSL